MQRFLTGILRDAAAAADIAQWTFLQLLEKGQEIPTDSVRSWLFRVAFNAAMNQRRHHAMELRTAERVAVWRLRSGRQQPLDLEQSVLDQEQRELLQAAIDQLNPDQRQIILARIVDNKKFVEIAGELQVPLGTVLTRMRSALAKLKQLMNRD